MRADLPHASYVVADLADPGTINGLGRQVDGPLDSLVHVAGVVDLAPVSRLRLHQWEEQITVNLTAPAVLTREFLPHVREAAGTVVFVNSSAGLTASAEWSAYAASKFGLRALADALRAEEVEHGVRGHHRVPEPHRDADAGEGPRAGGQDLRPVALDLARTPWWTRSCTCWTCRRTRRSPR